LWITLNSRNLVRCWEEQKFAFGRKGIYFVAKSLPNQDCAQKPSSRATIAIASTCAQNHCRVKPIQPNLCAAWTIKYLLCDTRRRWVIVVDDMDKRKSGEELDGHSSKRRKSVSCHQLLIIVCDGMYDAMRWRRWSSSLLRGICRDWRRFAEGSWAITPDPHFSKTARLTIT